MSLYQQEKYSSEMKEKAHKNTDVLKLGEY